MHRNHHYNSDFRPDISPVALHDVSVGMQEDLSEEEMSFRLPVPQGFSLRDSICSYGFFMLDPNRWIEHQDDEHQGSFRRPYHVPRGTMAISRFGAMLSRTELTDAEEAALLRALIRMSPKDIGMVHVVIRQEEAELCCVVEDEHVKGDELQVLEAVLRAQIRRMLRLSERELKAQRAFAAEYCRQHCGSDVSRCSPYFSLDTAIRAEEGPGAAGALTRATSCSKCGVRRHNRGRLFRSPHVWEDALRTVTLCNISWPGTRRMNRLLCSAFDGGLPLPSQLIGMDSEQLQKLCGVGYRAGRILALARAFLSEIPPERSGKKAPSPHLDLAWLEDPTRTEAEVYSQVLGLHGFGPYASATLCMLLGHYGSVAADTETVRHLLECHAIDTRPSSSARKGRGNGSPDKGRLQSALDTLYGRYGAHQFMAYWDELWGHYVAKVGVRHMAQLAETRYSEFTATTMAKMPGEVAAGKRKR